MRAGFIWLLRLASSRFSKWLGEPGRWAVIDRSLGQQRTACWDGEHIRGSPWGHVWGGWVEYSTVRCGTSVCVCVCVCVLSHAYVRVSDFNEHQKRNENAKCRAWRCVTYCIMLVFVYWLKYMAATTNNFQHWLICWLFSRLITVRKWKKKENAEKCITVYTSLRIVCLVWVTE